MRKLILAASAAAVFAACLPGVAHARYLQVDPVGYDDQNNLYAYVGNDPVNKIDPLGTYGRGLGFTDSEWEKFNRAQQHAAGKLEQRAGKLDTAVAAGGKDLAKAAAQFEKTFGKGTGTAANMTAASTNMKGMAAALRDNGSGGHMATGMSTSAWAAAGKGTDAMASNPIGTPNMSVNLGHAEFGNSRILRWSVGHESGHSIGLTHPRIGGIMPYAMGNPAQRALFNSLPSISPSAAMSNPDEVMLYTYGTIPN